MRKRSIPYRDVIGIQIILIITFVSLQFASFVSVSGSGAQVLSDGCTNVVVDDNRSLVYVADSNQNSIQIVDAVSDQIKATVWVGLGPYGIDISSNGTELYVALTGELRIAVIDLDALTLSRSISLSAAPYDLKAGLPGRIYVTTCETWNYPRIVDTINDTEICSITGAGIIYRNAIVEISHDGRTLFIAERARSPTKIIKFSLGDQTATVVSMVSFSSVGDMSMSSDDQELFVTVGPLYSVEIVDSGDWSIHGVLDTDLFQDPTSIALVCGDKYALVGYSSNIISDGVAIFNVTSRAKIASYDFGEDISRVRATADGGRLFCITITGRMRTLSLTPIAVINPSPNFGRSSVVFGMTISSPFDPYGATTPLSYRWDWEGDGTWDTDWSPSTSAQHHYSSEGNYLMCLEIRTDEGRMGRVTHILHVDDSPPITTPILNGSMGNDGWYISGVQMIFNADDAFTEINSTFWRIDSGHWILYNGTQDIVEQGNHTVEFYSIDLVSNSEPIRNLSFQIDTALPELRLTSTNLNFTSPTFDFPLYCSDNVSGMDQIRYSIDGESENSLTANHSMNLSGIKDGNHILSVIATDRAGNSIERDFSFHVDTDIFSTSGPFGPWLILLTVFASVGIVADTIVRSRKRISDWIRNRHKRRISARIEKSSVAPRSLSAMSQYPTPPWISTGSPSQGFRNTIVCVMCGSANPATARYCGYCRADIRLSVPLIQSSRRTTPATPLRICDGCQNPIDRGYKACPHCGRDYSAPRYHAPQFNGVNRHGRLTAIPIIGLLISLISAILGIIAVMVVYSMLPVGYYFAGWFSLLLNSALICGILAIPLSCYALLKKSFGAAVAGSIFSIIAGWALFGIFTMAIALLGLILIVIARDDFEFSEVPIKYESQLLDDW